jgi:NAD(P)-dependent dehydrogenase (short-subunit alcohol dehydrogenase family)
MPQPKNTGETDPRGQIALVTGAAAGIGTAIALALGRAGFKLALSARDGRRIEAVAALPDLMGCEILSLDLDLHDLTSIKAALEATFKRFGRVDVLVNNAGATLRKAALDLTEAEWDEVLDANLKGTFFLTQEVVRRVVDAGERCRIINVASAHGLVGFPNRLAYGVSKAGLVQLTRALAIEWAPLGITVNAVAPGTIATASRLEQMKNPQARAAMLDRIPLGRFGTPEEVGSAVAYLASPGAGFMTGHVLVMDGGATAA